MDILMKKMETDEEIKGKAYVHWSGWHTAYPGLVSSEYLNKLTLETCEQKAFLWRDNLLVAKEGEQVVGFVGYGGRGETEPDTGEIFALYVLPEDWGTGVAQKLMEAALSELSAYPKIALWMVKGNARANRFYEKCGFRPTGREKHVSSIGADGIELMLKR